MGITSLTTSFTSDGLIATGTAEDVLAVQVTVFAEDGTTILATLSTEVDDGGNFSLAFAGIAEGRYTVCAANYDGGECYTVNTWTEEDTPAEDTGDETSETSTATVADTGRVTNEEPVATSNYLAPAMAAVAIAIVAAIAFALIKKHKKSE